MEKADWTSALREEAMPPEAQVFRAERLDASMEAAAEPEMKVVRADWTSAPTALVPISLELLMTPLR